MKSVLTLAGLLVALGVGYFLYTKSLTSAGVADAPPQQTIDTIDIKTNLMNIGQAERIYLVSHGTYGTLEQLQQDGAPALLPPNNRGYEFSVTPNGAQSFTAVATPTDPNRPGWPTLTIDERMVVTSK
jgi:hypothetical protein